jgi:hypothetical protein
VAVGAFEHRPSLRAFATLLRAMRLLLALATIVLLPQCACDHTGMGDVLDAAAPLTRAQPSTTMRAQPAANSPKPSCKSLVWCVDQSMGVQLPHEIINAKGEGSMNGGPGTGHGSVAYIYGNMGAYPSDAGPLPQHANLSRHVDVLARNLASLIPSPDFSGLCVLDFERTRADWNSTSPVMRARSLLDAGNDTSLAIVQYESAIKTFMVATIETVRQVRPGCQVGWLNYPRSSYPHPVTPQWDQYCAAHPDICWGFNKPGDGPGTGYLGPGAAAQRAFNDKLHWLWDALDVITGVIYMTVGGETTVADTAAYVHSHAAEAVRLQQGSQARGGRSKLVVSVTWLLYDDVVDRQKAPQYLSASDATVVLSQPLAAEADGVLLWGHLNSSPGATGNNTVAAHNTYLHKTVAPIVTRVCGNWSCCTELPHGNDDGNDNVIR